MFKLVSLMFFIVLIVTGCLIYCTALQKVFLFLNLICFSSKGIHVYVSVPVNIFINKIGNKMNKCILFESVR